MLCTRQGNKTNPLHEIPSLAAYIPLAENSLKEPNGNYIYHHRYQLPEGLKGEFILLQWYYVTANSWYVANNKECLCIYFNTASYLTYVFFTFSSVEGYDTYNFAPGFDPGTATCEFVAPDGRGLPEQVSARLVIARGDVMSSYLGSHFMLPPVLELRRSRNQSRRRLRHEQSAEPADAYQGAHSC